MAAPARTVAWLEIANRALASIGQERIESLSESSQAANYCNMFLEEAVNKVASYHHWRATRERLELARDATAPLFGWTYRFPLPGDFLMVGMDAYGPQVENLDQSRIEYEIEGTYLLTDSETCRIIYHKTPASPAGLPPAIVAAMAFALAERLCSILTSSENLRALAVSSLQDALNKAVEADGKQRYELTAAAERGYTWPDEARF